MLKMFPIRTSRWGCVTKAFPLPPLNSNGNNWVRTISHHLLVSFGSFFNPTSRIECNKACCFLSYFRSSPLRLSLLRYLVWRIAIVPVVEVSSITNKLHSNWIVQGSWLWCEHGPDSKCVYGGRHGPFNGKCQQWSWNSCGTRPYPTPQVKESMEDLNMRVSVGTSAMMRSIISGYYCGHTGPKLWFLSARVRSLKMPALRCLSGLQSSRTSGLVQAYRWTSLIKCYLDFKSLNCST